MYRGASVVLEKKQSGGSILAANFAYLRRLYQLIVRIVERPGISGSFWIFVLSFM